ncbi:FkbM family methyltransferase [Paenibacillus elgii]
MQDFNQKLNAIKDKITDLVQKGFYGESIEIIQQLEGVIPYDTDIISIKSTILYHLNDLKKAEEVAEIGLLLNPTDSDLLYNLAYVLFQAEKDSQARFMLSIAIDYCKDPELLKYLFEFLEDVERKYQLSDKWGIQGEGDSFLFLLLKEVYSNLPNHFKHNVDIDYMDLTTNPIQNVQIIDVISERKAIVKHIEGLSRLFDVLHDEFSKRLLLQVLSFRILGNLKVQLPLNSLEYWNQRKQIKTLVASPDTLVTSYEHWQLQKYALNEIGYPIEMYNLALGIHAVFLVKQYEYHHSQIQIKAQKNDIVIDCGGCWGDTALYFANEVGQLGKVYTVEFIPSNLNILYRNLDLNPTLKERINVIPNPVWNVSDQSAYYIDRGCASLVSMEPFGEVEEKVQTLAIDDLVINYGLDRVDFIKMDVEGAEMNALKGAANSICKFRPTLAISLYHQISDFQAIPEFISQISEDYIFTLKHCTILTFETILFAIPREKFPSK